MSIILAESLSDFTAARRKAIWWKALLTPREGHLDSHVRAVTPEPCRDWTSPWRQRQRGSYKAHLGSDGRYHLSGNNGLICSDTPSSAVAFLHHQECHWWTDGKAYSQWTPASAWDPTTETLLRGARYEHPVTWHVTVDPAPIAPETIPARQRCVHYTTNLEWPAHLDPTNRIGRIRIRLVNELGSTCHACGKDIGVTVDHDHFTGLVRGLLCRECNTFIDDCLHLSGCLWADYLNAPPAKSLRLLYPHPDKVRSKDSAQRKIAYLGYDPLYSGPQRQRRLSKERPGPPPPSHSAQLKTQDAIEEPLF